MSTNLQNLIAEEANERTNLLAKPINDNEVPSNENVRHTRTTNGGVSWYFAVFLIVNAALGAGLLNFAKAFDNAGGIAISITVQLVISNKINEITLIRTTMKGIQ